MQGSDDSVTPPTAYEIVVACDESATLHFLTRETQIGQHS